MWQRTCSEEECILCGARRLAPGTSTWMGTGIYEYLNAAEYQNKDPPIVGTGVGVFANVPRPPDKWMPERFSSRGFLGLINTRSDKAAALAKLEDAARQGGAADASSGTSSGAAIDVDDEGMAAVDEPSDALCRFDVMLSDDGSDYAMSDRSDCCDFHMVVHGSLFSGADASPAVLVSP